MMKSSCPVAPRQVRAASKLDRTACAAPHNKLVTLVTLAARGAARRRVDIRDIEVPDLWDLAMWLKRHESQDGDSELVLQVWGLAHDLKRHIEKSAGIRRRFYFATRA